MGHGLPGVIGNMQANFGSINLQSANEHAAKRNSKTRTNLTTIAQQKIEVKVPPKKTPRRKSNK